MPDWDTFDPDSYWREHYAALRADDGQILALLADWFAQADLPDHAHAVDVGAGANLYPALAMLPHARRITLIEYGAPNRSWLQRQVGSMAETWQPFWNVLCDQQATVYKQVHSPRTALAGRTDVTPGSVYELPVARWDLGTMFFVAESITPVRSQFQVATRSFVRSLQSGAPFAAAFMTGSVGYRAGAAFPAVPVEGPDIAAALKPVAQQVEVHRIVSDPPLRPGVGMILATGYAR